MTPDRIRIGQRIRELRQQQGLTQRDLAQMADITQPNLVNIENGKYSIKLDTLSKIATALHATVEIIC